MSKRSPNLHYSIPSPSSVKWRLGALFAAMYFAQGISEPTEGLLAQPVRTLLRSWGSSPSAIGTFGALLAIPWALKPLYGLLSDFVPLGGSRRRNYLLVCSAAAVVGLLGLYCFPPAQGNTTQLLLVLTVPTIGIAFSDVVVDALMVEKGQPLGLTGWLQSVQWTAMYAATLLAGFLGGTLSQHARPELGFVISALAVTATLVLTVMYVRDRRARNQSFWPSALGLWRELRSPAVWAVAAFLVLWNFNPFASTVLQLYTTETLHLGEQFYGTMVALVAVGAMAASLAYGWYCRRVRWLPLLHASVVAGVASTAAYWFFQGRVSGAIVSLIVGFSYMTGTLVQMDLAAQTCAPQVAGTTFATFMALSNLSFSMSAAVGADWYQRWSDSWGTVAAFRLLVVVGAGFTAACWLLVWAMPTLRMEGKR